MRRQSTISLITIAFALAITTALAACDVPQAQGAPPPADVALAPVADCAAGSLCFTSRWTAVSDSAGAADHYRVRIVAPGVSVDTTVTATSIGFRVPCAPGATGSITADVWSVRRGKESANSKRATASFACPDPAPPAPGSVVIAPDSTGAVVNPNPPAGDVGGDSLPSSVGALFVTPRDTSPHLDHIRRTMTDYCNCWGGSKGAAARAKAAKTYDLIMSGSPAAWVALNPSITQLRYALAQTTLTEEPDTNGFVDSNSITGRWQYDAREWYAAHPQYDYERLWLHQLGDSTPADSAHRLRFLIWKNYRYALNPLDPGARAYTINRLRRSIEESGGSRGLFLDEMDHNAWRWLGQSREGAGMDTTTWHAAVVGFVKTLRDSLAPAVLQSNAAGYSSREFDAAIGMAAGNMHLEQMLLATQVQPSIWDFVDRVVAAGTDVDFVAAETWTDFLRPSFTPKYPPGNYGASVYRGKVFQLASYYMVIDSLARRVGLQSDNTRGFTPDSVDLPIYYLDVGHPKAPRYVWQNGKDALGQAATIYRRDFDNAGVLARPITSYKYPTMTDTTAVAVTLPPGGPWSMVMARGEVVSIDSLELRNSEAAILVRRQ